MKKEKTVTIKNSHVHIIGVIHGLEKEGERVKNAFSELKPDCLALGIPKEDVATIEKFVRDGIEFEMSPEQEHFFEHLSRYGKTGIPPPDLLVSYRICIDEGVPLEPLDMDDERYAEVFTKKVSLISFIRNSRRIKKLGKKDLKSSTAEEFVEEWERNFYYIRGFRAIEMAREENMASRLFSLADRYEKILAVIPYQRFDGVIDSISSLKKHKNGRGITTWC